MNRVVVFGQPGAFGQALCTYVADRLAKRLGVPKVTAAPADDPEAAPFDSGWIAIVTADRVSWELFRAADTAIWLHYPVLAVVREWLRHLRRRAALVLAAGAAPRLTDLLGSLRHKAWAPYVRRWLQDPSLAHLHIHHLRSPAETDFWLYAQDHRLAPISTAQPA